MISGGHLVAKALKAEGIDVIFTLCGGHIIDIYDGCVDEGIEVIDVRHEQVAAHAADGYARITGKPGCAVVTAGPGTTDAVTGVANAFRAESPMLLIGGQGALNQHKMGSLQDLPHVDMMTPITKFAATVPHDRARRRHGARWRSASATTGAPGPSFLEIPRDILDDKVPRRAAGIPEAGRYRASTKSIGDPDEHRARWPTSWSTPRSPACCSAARCGRRAAPSAAIEFVRELNIPAYMNGAARGTLPPGDPHHFHLSRRYAFNNADVILIVGTPFDFRMGYGKRLRAGARPSSRSTWTTARSARTATSTSASSATRARSWPRSPRPRRAAQQGDASARRWLDELRAEEDAAVREAAAAACMSDAAPIHPLRLAHEINEFLTEDSHLHRRRRRHRHLLRRRRPAQGARPLDGPGPARHPRRRHPVRDGGQVRATRTRRWSCLFGDGALQPHRLGLRDAGALRPPVRRRRRQQLLHEPDPLRPDPKYGEERGEIGNKLGDVQLRRVRQDARRLRRGGPRAEGHPAGARAGPRVAASRR